MRGVKFDTHSYAEYNLKFGYWLNLEIVTNSYINNMVRMLFVQLSTGITNLVEYNSYPCSNLGSFDLVIIQAVAVLFVILSQLV